MATAPTETFEFRTHLAAGRELDYEHFHRAIPAPLDRVMREAGVLGWRIYRNGTTLTHLVEARDRAEMAATLDADPTNRAWQEQVAPFLGPGPDDAASQTPSTDAAVRGALIWDLSWPTR
jgi:L-rhamnose mutarotase